MEKPIYTPKDIFRDASDIDLQKLKESKSLLEKNKVKSAITALTPIDSPATIYQYTITATDHSMGIDPNGEFIVADTNEEEDYMTTDVKDLLDQYVAAYGTHPLVELAYAKYWTTITIEQAFYMDESKPSVDECIQEADKHYIAAMLREYYTQDTFLDWAYILASEHLGTAEYDKAIQILKWGVMIYPNATFNYHLANKLYYSENWEETITSATTALSMDKKEKVLDEDSRLDLYYFLCYANSNLGNYDATRKGWSQAAKEFKSDTSIVYNQGLLELSCGNFTKARKFFTKAFNMNQNDLESIMQAIGLYFGAPTMFPDKQTHIDEAIILADQLIKNSKTTYTKTVINYYKVQLLVLDYQFEKALPLLDEVEAQFISQGDDPEITHQYIQEIRDLCNSEIQRAQQ